MRLRGALAGLLAALVLAGCSEKDRKAWVSILPSRGDHEEAAPAEAGPPHEGFGLSADSTAVLLDADTLFSIDRLPARGPGDAPLRGTTFRVAALSPDSAQVAFATGGGHPVVGIWTRVRQSASLVAGIPDGVVERMTWAPGGRFVAWQARVGDGPEFPAAYDARVGQPLRHAVLGWLRRHGRSAWIQDWIDDNRLRVRVGADADTVGGLAYTWELRGGSFFLEDHLGPLGDHAPQGSALPLGSVFSLDLTPEPGPESVAFYLDSAGAPGALVLRSRGSSYRATTTDPLLDPAELGLEEWKDLKRGALLYEVADFGDRKALLLLLPDPEVSWAILGFYEVTPDARVVPVRIVDGGRSRPALFPRGRAEDRLFDLGLTDLDGDGVPEVVSAVGTRDVSTLEPRVAWNPDVYRWQDGRLVPAPDLDEAAVQAMGRIAGDESEE